MTESRESELRCRLTHYLTGVYSKAKRKILSCSDIALLKSWYITQKDHQVPIHIQPAALHLPLPLTMPSLAAPFALALAVLSVVLGAPTPLRGASSTLAIAPLARQAACGDGDVACVCQAAVSVTNRIRAENGKGSLVAGPVEMLNNAVEHTSGWRRTAWSTRI